LYRCNPSHAVLFGGHWIWTWTESFAKDLEDRARALASLIGPNFVHRGNQRYHTRHPAGAAHSRLWEALHCSDRLWYHAGGPQQGGPGHGDGEACRQSGAARKAVRPAG